MTKFKHIVDSEQGSAISPDKIANLVYKILNKKNPKHKYVKNTSKKLKLLNLCSTKLQLKLLNESFALPIPFISIS